MLGSYVDDIKATGPDDELKQLWAEMAKDFKWKADPEELVEFLGASYHRRTEERDGELLDILEIDLENYIQQTVDTFNDLFLGEGKKNLKRKKKKNKRKKPELFTPVSKVTGKPKTVADLARRFDRLDDARVAMRVQDQQIADYHPGNSPYNVLDKSEHQERVRRVVPISKKSCTANIRSKWDLRGLHAENLCATCGQNVPLADVFEKAGFGRDQSKWPKCEPTDPEQAVQIMVGRLLWIARVCRPDIGHAVSALGSRVSCWDESCTEQLTVLVGYLKYTKRVRLEMSWPKRLHGTPDSVLPELHTDADHRGGDKSQSSFMCWLKPKDCKVGGIPLHWLSKKQTISADAVSSAEVVASHLGFKEGMWGMMTVLIAQRQDPHSVTLRADNTVCLQHITGRPTDTVYFRLKAVDARGGFMSDLYNCGFFNASHVESAYNRSDPGTKVCSSVREQEWFRALCGLQWPEDHEDQALRRQGLLDTNGPAPDKRLLKPDVNYGDQTAWFVALAAMANRYDSDSDSPCGSVGSD